MDDTGGPTWGARGSHTLLNTNLERVDGPAKASGTAKYTYDVRVPGMLYGRILHVAPRQRGGRQRGYQRRGEDEGVKAVINLGKTGSQVRGRPGCRRRRDHAGDRRGRDARYQGGV